MLQNVPEFVISVHAAWLVGAVITPVNPMNTARELVHQLTDAGVRVAICLDSLSEELVAAKDTTPLEHVVTVFELDGLDSVPTTLAGIVRQGSRDRLDFADLVRSHLGATVDPPRVGPESPALITYTSGTTGLPKGAVNTHRAVAFSAENWKLCFGLDETDVVLAIAPLFHITGFIGHLAVAQLLKLPIILSHRFDAGETLRLAERWHGTYTVGALTAFIALMTHPDFDRRDLSSLTKVGSGGAPVSAAVADRWEAATGTYLHNCYGLTETTTLVAAVPIGLRAPVDERSGALSVGLPVPGVDLKIVDSDGRVMGMGDAGELLVKGPMVMARYWGRPEATAEAIVDGWLRTGDIGVCDAAGWVYVIDRLKDMIIASGYKVWPREVEDVLYQHPAVVEASVIGVPDDYRGETVRAYVVAAADAAPTRDELIAHCRKGLAAYKVPREIEFGVDLPKTATGKVLRRALRDGAKDSERSGSR
jgi:long-chain acyl-CoA synthetase